VDPVPDPLLLGKSGSAGKRTRNSGSVAGNSDHWTKTAAESVDTVGTGAPSGPLEKVGRKNCTDGP
jgi:hypothetical protein